MANIYKIRRMSFALIYLFIFAIIIVLNTPDEPVSEKNVSSDQKNITTMLALTALENIPIKGRAPKTGYTRDQFGKGWIIKNGCDMRNIILNRDLKNPKVDELCNIISGILSDPYTGSIIQFNRGDEVQIDHVVALSDAWQKGAQLMNKVQRIEFANDPLELLAVSGSANQQKSDGDAATWLPPNKAFRCQYIARQIAVKNKYKLWITKAEYTAMSSVLAKCPSQMLPGP